MVSWKDPAGIKQIPTQNGIFELNYDLHHIELIPIDPITHLKNMYKSYCSFLVY